MKKLLLLLAILVLNNTFAQTYKFGKVSKAELAEKICSIDSSANAAILYKERYTHFEYSQDEGFSMMDEYFVRIKIYNKEGFDYATKKIYLHQQNNTKAVAKNIKAYSYNLVNGKIVKTKLDKKAIFSENLNKYTNVKKFTMPNIKAGTIIEYKYIVYSPFIGNIAKVEVQDFIPTKKFLAIIKNLEYFMYKAIPSNYYPITMKSDRSTRTLDFISHYKKSIVSVTKSQMEHVTATEYIKTIDMKNIPALKKEAYAGNINNYKAAVDFELLYSDFPSKPRHLYSTDWQTVTKKIYQNASFGGELNKTAHFKEDLSNVLSGATSNDDKIIKILAFVKQKIKWNNTYGIYTDKGTKKAYKEGVGDIADINLNLVAMLRQAGFNANPVLVSTISHGIPIFPTQTGFNYVIAHISYSDGSYTLLDATDKYSLPNILPERTHNYYGRLIKRDGTSSQVDLYPQSYAVKKYSIRAKFDGEQFSGSARRIIAGDYLIEYRNEMTNLSKEKQIETLEEETNIEIEKISINNIEDLTKNISENIQFTTSKFSENIGGKTFITPMLYLQKTNNPFKTAKRDYPIYYNSPWIQNVTLYIAIPDNYTIASVPEATTIQIEGGIGSYTYSVIKQGQFISVKSDLRINQAVVSQLNYQQLKDFYTAIIKKQAEKIVLVKK